MEKPKRNSVKAWISPLATSLWGCENVARYICANTMFSEQEVRERLHFEITSLAKYQVQYWPIFERNTNAFIGCCGLRPLLDSYELGCHLLKEHWHQGHATEACEQVISYAFSVMKQTQLYAGHHPDNIASKRLLKKLSFSYIGDNYYEPTGLLHPSYELRNPSNVL